MFSVGGECEDFNRDTSGFWCQLAARRRCKAQRFGDTVKLKHGASLGDTETQAPEPTKITLLDESGRPMAGRRLVVETSETSERSGVLDAQGTVTLELSEAAKLEFSDVFEPEQQ